MEVFKLVLKGIDLSSNNHDLNFKKYDGDIIIYKLTGGASYFWKENKIKEALSKGFLVGCYHFAHEYGKIVNSRVQAEYFYKHYKPYLGLVYPILDYEIALNGKNFTQHDLNWIDNFMIEFHKLSGVYPMLYCSKSLILANRVPKFTKHNCPLWFAQYANMNPTGWQSNPWTDSNNVDMLVIGQQYSSNGHLSSIQGPVDLSQFYISKKGWLLSCKSYKQGVLF